MEIAKPDFKARMAVKLAVAGAFHTDFMAPAVGKLEEVLKEVDVKKPRIPVISNVDAKAHSDPAVIKDILTKQVPSRARADTPPQPPRPPQPVRGRVQVLTIATFAHSPLAGYGPGAVGDDHEEPRRGWLRGGVRAGTWQGALRHHEARRQKGAGHHQHRGLRLSPVAGASMMAVDHVAGGGAAHALREIMVHVIALEEQMCSKVPGVWLGLHHPHSC